MIEIKIKIKNLYIYLYYKEEYEENIYDKKIYIPRATLSPVGFKRKTEKVMRCTAILSLIPYSAPLRPPVGHCVC